MTWPTSPEPTADSKPAAPPRFRDGIKWGLLAIIAVPVMRYQSLVPLFALIVLPAVAGIRAKSLRPAIGAIATAVLVLGILYGVVLFQLFRIPP